MTTWPNWPFNPQEKNMTERIYVVHDTQRDEKTLVLANNPAQALRHITSDRFDVRAAGALEVASLMGQGVVVSNSLASVVTPEEQVLVAAEEPAEEAI
jgi:hypothetical protein